MKTILSALIICLLIPRIANAQDWKLTGNTGTNPAINFIGTKDAAALTFKVNNQRSGLIDYTKSKANTIFGYQAARSTASAGNSVFGYQALFKNTAGYSNVAIGREALRNNITGHNLVAIGDSALYNQAADNFRIFANTAVGSKALFTNSYGFENTAIGHKALFSNDGSGNTAIGASALQNNTSGGSNTAIGKYSLSSNTSGLGNTATGSYSLYNNTIGYNNVAYGSSALIHNVGGSNNTANGVSVLYENISGSNNTGIGYWSLVYNTTGYSNTAIGAKALFNNKTGHNQVAIGDSSLFNYAGTSGYNTAIGSKTLYNNTGTYNTANGYQALYNNTTGFYNTGNGFSALWANTTGIFNTAFGSTALANNTGSYNTAVGSSSDVNPGYKNSTALGFGAVATGSNQVMLGNSSVSSVRTYGSIIWSSDGRFKKNIKENVPGLAFIQQLRPVTYNYDIHRLNAHSGNTNNRLTGDEKTGATDKMLEDGINKKEQIIYTGFIAQEVEKTANKMGYDFSGIYKPADDKDSYGLDYAEFVVPLVKAVQELSKSNNDKDEMINDLKTRLEKIEALLNPQSSTINSKIQKTNIAAASLEQNVPNPFTGATMVNYTLPSIYSSAKIIIYDKAGKALKQLNISGSGKGSLKIDASLLSNSAYHYSLYVDGKLIDSKQMEHLR